jgi:hypothetical protein
MMIRTSSRGHRLQLGAPILVGVVGVIGLAGCAVDSTSTAAGSVGASVVPVSAPRALTHREKSAARMSPTARLAQSLTHGPFSVQSAHSVECEHSADCEPTSPKSIAGELAGVATRSETSIAVDATGKHVVIGYNDFRGFTSTTISLSGVSYSDDGGKTFVDAGQLPVGTTTTINGALYPQVFGDPEIKYLGACTFVYASILMKKFAADPADTGTVETMSVHRSTDCGHTWEGPFEVTAATQPSGGAAPTDAADKEFLTIDPDTGRAILSWTNFSATAAEISTAYSDDLRTAAVPTWSTRTVVAATQADGQGSIPRAAGRGSKNAYVAWGRYGNTGDNVAVARSTDNGATWSAPLDLAPFAPAYMDEILGNDRVHNFPSLAVDNSRGPHKGTVYVVYAPNDAGDGADIVVQKSTDEGVSFSPPLKLNARIGGDRAQWFPWTAVDDSTGRVYVFYYDQGIAQSGDLMETTYTWSDDGGTTWSRPRPMSARPFHGGIGNNFSQPNLGDYNQIVAQHGELFAVYAETHPVGFAEGQPSSGSMSLPAAVVKRIRPERLHRDDTVALGHVTFVDSSGDGVINRDELLTVKAPLVNYVTNPLNAATLHGVTSVVTTKTPGVVVLFGVSPYPALAPGETKENELPIFILTTHDFVAGTPIELELQIGDRFSGQSTLLATLQTGTPVATVLLNETFDASATGSLGAGWAQRHISGATTVPWTATSTYCATKSPAAFQIEANDGPAGGSSTRSERLRTPLLTVPADSEYVTLDFDVCYDLEDEPISKVRAFDGLLVSVSDLTPGRTARLVLAEAFEQEQTFGLLNGYTKHYPRVDQDADNVFEDMSAWSGDSSGWQHVHMRLPGMAASQVRVNFEYQQDQGGTCADVRPGHACGVAVDNVVVSSIVSAKPKN